MVGLSAEIWDRAEVGIRTEECRGGRGLRGVVCSGSVGA